jgi:hypothetical protein
MVTVRSATGTEQTGKEPDAQAAQRNADTEEQKYRSTNDGLADLTSPANNRSKYGADGGQQGGDGSSCSFAHLSHLLPMSIRKAFTTKQKQTKLNR